MELKGKRMVPMAIVLALVILTFMAAAPEAARRAVEIVIECSQPDCQNKCIAAYGSRLIRSECVPDPTPLGGNICVCYHTPPAASTLT
ncbi:hypothetical protein CRYUN_Cryun09bG0086300 [Craigia yunnanensis]